MIGRVWGRSPHKLNAFLSQRVIVALKWGRGAATICGRFKRGRAVALRPPHLLGWGAGEGAAERGEAAAPTASPLDPPLLAISTEKVSAQVVMTDVGTVSIGDDLAGIDLIIFRTSSAVGACNVPQCPVMARNVPSSNVP